MPPEPPESKHKMGHLYRLLRPELVKKSPVPLCPDTYSCFLSGSQDKEQKDIKNIFDMLQQDIIPKFAQKLDELGDSPNFQLIVELHYEGINVRYLGNVFNLVKNPFWKSKILLEMIARVLKDYARKILKEQVIKKKSPGEAPYKFQIVQLLNVILGKNDKTLEYWKYIFTALNNYFLVDASMAILELNSPVSWKHDLFHCLSTMCGFCWHSYFIKALSSNANFFSSPAPITPMMLKCFKPIMKKMNVALQARACMLKAQMQNLQSSENVQSLEDALSSQNVKNPQENSQDLQKLQNSQDSHSQDSQKLQNSQVSQHLQNSLDVDLLKKCKKLFRYAIQAYPSDKSSLRHLGDLFVAEGQVAEARECYGRASEMDGKGKENVLSISSFQPKLLSKIDED